MPTEIKTLQNPAKTKSYLPRTCLKAIADKNGDYLDEDLEKSDIDALKNGKIATMDAALTSLNPTPIAFTAGTDITLVRCSAWKIGKMVFICGMASTSVNKGYPDPILTLDDYTFAGNYDYNLLSYTDNINECGFAVENTNKVAVNSVMVSGKNYVFQCFGEVL